ncbi:BCLAF1 and THRAP3 family member 3 isoform X2 [Syngnathoides biaculeatus]|uniref:BCLAF1 and THRAP3 family member 3 isoform X2 n=1 Tax=Syngnathoides biaculeatus TaxID=300417 RepID=UPI002ADE269F|nr:BCLAF1 and THRAP3 family member 3 isoform X2 [Syngnathoides biaculeatus]XP_061661901.1 BCLAF1 and THRAP3 family member 3 isoform X2 [Syngnathoides biaculeatus]
MSRQRSPSPPTRRFPWNEYGHYRPTEPQHTGSSDRRPISRDEERRFGVDSFPEGQRRPSLQDEHHHLRLSPNRDSTEHHVLRGSPQRYGRSEADRQRRGLGEDLQNFNSRGRPPFSPLRFPREQLLLQPIGSLLDLSEGKSDWRQDEEGRGQGRFRDVNPGIRSDEQRGSKGESKAESLNRSRQREDVHPPSKRPRREMDGHRDSGFRRDDKDFGDQRYSPTMVVSDRRRDALVKNARVFPHDQGVPDSQKPLQWEHSDNRKQRDSDMRQTRMSDNRPIVREDTRKRHFPDNWRDGAESKKSDPPRERTDFARFDRKAVPTNQRGTGGPHPDRGRFSHNQVGNSGNLTKNRTNFEQSSRCYQDTPRDEAKATYRSQRKAVEEEAPRWTDEDGHLKQVWPGSLVPSLHRGDLEADSPRPDNVWEVPEYKNVTVVSEETLTIKVDMSRPGQHTSIRGCSRKSNTKIPRKKGKCSMSYSADRQLSLDLVNVGRQRLDFLPEASQSNKGSGDAHAGTFAQEIITLVHRVKELYFRGEGITLNNRFSQLHPRGNDEEEGAGLTLNQRFSANNLNMTMVHQDIRPLIPGLRGLRMSHSPGDLRHDLERRRQKRLEGVTITIQGSGRPSPAKVKYDDPDVTFADERHYRRETNAGPGKRGRYRMNAGPTQRFKNR